MKLLVLTQKVNKNDPILGFFHRWLEEFSKRFEKITVICLEEGEYKLPENVKVFSLGKVASSATRRGDGKFIVPRASHIVTSLKYVWKFYKYIWQERKNYDAVFVHMNQEYMLLGGLFWKILGRKVFLWRNHPKGNFLTKIAMWFSDKVFTTTPYSFVAKSKKSIVVPVGIDSATFKDLKIEKLKGLILFLGRMSPIKRPELLVKALGILKNKGVDFKCDFYGEPLPKDEDYFNGVRAESERLDLKDSVDFYKAIPNYETPKIYNQYQIYVNLTPSGSMDKTILEAIACGCIPIVSNVAYKGVFDEKMITGENPGELAEKIIFWLNEGSGNKNKISDYLQKYVLENHSLDALTIKLKNEMK